MALAYVLNFVGPQVSSMFYAAADFMCSIKDAAKALAFLIYQDQPKKDQEDEKSTKPDHDAVPEPKPKKSGKGKKKGNGKKRSQKNKAKKKKGKG